METQLFDCGKKTVAFAAINGTMLAVLAEIAFTDNPYNINCCNSRVCAAVEQIASEINETAH